MFALNPEEISFPDPSLYHPENGILAFGGDLSPERLLFAYQNGIFPWYNPGEEILWWCPDPRFVLFPGDLKISKSMQKILRRDTFTYTENQNFQEVMENCKKAPRRGQEGTWISDELVASFIHLHKLGIARSVEVWHDKTLVGGFYGIQIGKVFCGESMFAKVSNASKAGFLQFVLKNRDIIKMVDCQSYTEHLESLGAKMIPKIEFLKILKENQ